MNTYSKYPFFATEKNLCCPLQMVAFEQKILL